MKYSNMLSVNILMIIVCGFCICVTGCVSADREKIVQQDAGAEKTVLQPEIRFDAVYHDFGKVVQGSKVSHSFAFKNVGNDVLKVGKVGAG